MANPFRERPASKKRLINVSVTVEQAEAFDNLREHLELPSAGALIKVALAELTDRVAAGEYHPHADT